MMIGLPAEVECNAAVRLGGGAVANVEVQAGKQEREPAGGDEQVPSLRDRESSLEELADVPELL
jgi:hypothetical protein